TFAPQLWNIAGYYACLLPFYFLAGLYVSLNFVLHDAEIGRVYGYDLTGAGAGALLVLALMAVVHPFRLVPCLLVPPPPPPLCPPRGRAVVVATAALALLGGAALLLLDDEAAFNDY